MSVEELNTKLFSSFSIINIADKENINILERRLFKLGLCCLIIDMTNYAYHLYLIDRHRTTTNPSQHDLLRMWDRYGKHSGISTFKNLVTLRNKICHQLGAYDDTVKVLSSDIDTLNENLKAYLDLMYEWQYDITGMMCTLDFNKRIDTITRSLQRYIL